MTARRLWLAGALVIALPLGAYSQAMVEYTLGVGRAAAGAPAAKKAGEATAAALEKLGKTLEQGGQAAPKSAARSPEAPQTRRAGRPLGPFADPAGITVGLDRQELLRKFGEPRMRTTGGAEGAETCWYTSGTGDSFAVTVRDGKVTAVTSEPKKKPESSAVVIVQ